MHEVRVLSDCQFCKKRERLRHIAHAIARIEVGGIDRPAQEQRLARRRGQQPGEHLHRRRFSAAVRPEKSENLAALDGEAHAINRGEIAKAAGEIVCHDDGLVLVRPVRGIRNVRWPARR